MTAPQLPSALCLEETCCFANLSPSLLSLTGEHVDRVGFAPGETIFHQGDPADVAYIVTTGEAELIADTSEGLIRLAVIGPRQSFGELALFCDSPRLCTARACSHVEALRVTRTAYQALTARYPEIANIVVSCLSRRLVAALHALRIARTAANLGPTIVLHPSAPSIYTC